ncbi:LOW QUALITY PROTEIN: endonuclease-reverse transcriptase [Plakobranchus ocellatus]|uniref:Endonuclease-reverse transcriptase n=1 Tax=Plakobranchus ocellatus TaxID=259542 RepID=A0AAV4ADI0_9GAST|nr:LOW QUALITY PROTEIN: endonuclease-reverse transcriptase [Plakobranchus ocellatus]
MNLNTWYQQHPRRRYTWISPGDRCRNQIDYILVQKTWHSSFIKCKTKPGADCDTDHILVVAKIKLKSYRKKSDNNPLIRYELNKLQESNTQRFEALLDTCEEKTPEELWLGMKNIWTEAPENTLGKKKSMKKKPWISTETIELANEKRKARKNNEKGK